MDGYGPNCSPKHRLSSFNFSGNFPCFEANLLMLAFLIYLHLPTWRWTQRLRRTHFQALITQLFVAETWSTLLGQATRSLISSTRIICTIDITTSSPWCNHAVESRLSPYGWHQPYKYQSKSSGSSWISQIFINFTRHTPTVFLPVTEDSVDAF